MSDLMVIVYPAEAKAVEMRTKLFSLQKEYLIEIGDAVIAVKREDWTTRASRHKKQEEDRVAGKGACAWKLLIQSNMPASGHRPSPNIEHPFA